jgi:alpha/beta superfamily hydrolase
VYRIAKAFNEAGFTALRFNFRGVGLSAGSHDAGNGEQQDLVAAIDFVERTYPGDEIWLAGFSFGSAVMLKVACPEPRVARLIAVGVPVSMYDLDQLPVCGKPKLFVQGSRDQFGPVDQLEKFFRRVGEPKKLAIIDDADHFFEGHLGEMADAISRFIEESLEISQPNGV